MDARAPLERSLGGWTLHERVGAGAFGEAWRATDPEGRIAVVKLLDRPPGEEVRALSRVRHPAVVELLGAGTQPRPHLVMSLAPGRPLTHAMGALAEDEAIRVVAVLADALATCHAVGIAHGDVKPENVLYDPASGAVTLVDFGLAGGAGGTIRYAAPEILDGGGASARGDVYALGLVAWELLHAALPTLAAGRRAGPPMPTSGPDWFRETLVQMLASAPGARPTAADVADQLEAAGVPLASPTAADVARRGSVVQVARPEVDAALAAWLDEGGRLALVGPSGSGRSHLISRVSHELLARGVPHTILTAGGPAWSAVRVALADPGLPGAPVELPAAADLPARAEAAASALLARFSGQPVVLVDDLDQLDEGSAAVVAHVARAARCLVTAATQPSGYHMAEPSGFTPSQIGALLQSLLGCDDPAIAALFASAVGDLPRDLVAFAVAAVRAGAVTWRRRQWVADPDALDRLAAAGLPSAAPHLSESARWVGALVAEGQPLERGLALALAQQGEGAVEELSSAGWIRTRGALTCASRAARAALRAAAPDLVEVHRRLRDHWLGEARVPWERLGWSLVGCGDVALAAELGPRCVEASKALDVAEGLELAEALWALAPTPALFAARLDALVQAGHRARARAEGAAWLADRPGAEAAPVLLALARLEDASTEDGEVILTLVSQARAALDGPETDELTFLEARALFRLRRLAEAATVCDRVRCSPDPDLVAAATGLLAQVRALLDGPRAGLDLLEGADHADLSERSVALLGGIRGRLLWMAGHPREAARAMEEAARHRRSLPTVERGRLENNAALCWYSSGDVERAVAGWERALLCFERTSADAERVRTLVNLCQGLRDLGRWPRARQAGEDAVSQARRHGLRAFEAVALGNLGDVALWERRFATAARLWHQAEELATREGLTDELVEIQRRWAELAATRRDPDASERAASARRAAIQIGHEVEAARCAAIEAVLLARRGAATEARRAAAEALEPLRQHGAGGALALARLWVAEAFRALDLRDQAVAEATEALSYADEFGLKPLRAWAERVLEGARSSEDAEQLRLARLTELAVRVSSQTGLEDLLGELAATALELVDAERAFVLLVEDDRARVVASAGVDAASRPPAMSVVRRALSLGREVIVTDLEERSDLRDADSIVDMRLRAVVCLPLARGEHGTPGALYLDSQQQPVSRLGDSVAMLRALAAHASVALRNARQTRELHRRAEHAREIVHDLRNPLSGALLLAEDLLATGAPMDPEDGALLIDALRHAAELVERSLEPPQDTSQVLGLDAAVLRWVHAQLRQARGVGVGLLVDVGTDGCVRADEAELRRAVANLIGNAIKYSPWGATVHVRTLARGDRLGVQIDDQGPGVPDEVRSRIFERGVQGPLAAPGHGLGLSIVRAVAASHGGSVEVDNAPGGGARFTLWLPRA